VLFGVGTDVTGCQCERLQDDPHFLSNSWVIFSITRNDPVNTCRKQEHSGKEHWLARLDALGRQVDNLQIPL